MSDQRSREGKGRVQVLDRLFLSHPRSLDESYLEHGRTAARFGGLMLLGGLAILVHALIPGLFVSTGSRLINQLHDDMVGRQPR